jgi:hypothetical protein
MFRVQAWNAMGGKVDDPSPPMELKDALQLVVAYRNRGLRRITLMDTKTGEEFTDLEHFVRQVPEA